MPSRLAKAAGATPPNAKVKILDVDVVAEDYQRYCGWTGRVVEWDGSYYTVRFDPDQGAENWEYQRNFEFWELELTACEGVLAARERTDDARSSS